MPPEPAQSATRYIEACPVGCAGSLDPTALVLPEGPLLKCTECAQLVSQVSAARYWEAMQAFDEPQFNQPTPHELARRISVAQRRLKRIAALLGQPPAASRLIDVGCSRGHFVAAAAARGFKAEGVEPAPQIAAAAREAGLVVHSGLLEDLQLPDASFDAVTLFEVLEHLKEPIALVRECARILKPGGILCVTTGNAASWTVACIGARWDYFHIEQDAGHVSFFNPASLALLAQRGGFRPEAIETARVKFFDKGEVSRARYALGKLAAECLSLPARLAGRGHDMIGYLRRG